MPSDVTSAGGQRIGTDELLALQLAVARKADELARSRSVGPGLNLHCWLLAEAEVLGGSVIDTLAPTSGFARTQLR
jgi:hypothetical protein